MLFCVKPTDGVCGRRASGTGPSGPMIIGFRSQGGVQDGVTGSTVIL